MDAQLLATLDLVEPWVAAGRYVPRCRLRAVLVGEGWERVLQRTESMYRQVLAIGAGVRPARAVPVAVTE